MKTRGYIPPVNDDERLFVRRVKELAESARNSGTPRQTAFLTDREQALAAAALSSVGFSDYLYDGGYPGAERKLLCLCGEFADAGTPHLICLFLEAMEEHASLTHRDYLGALLSLGVKRACIGDILLCEGGAYVFVLKSIAPLLREELCRVGRCSVRVSSAQAGDVPQQRERPLRTVSVASLRLDALLSAMLHISRSDAAQLVKSGAVEINHVPAASIHAGIFTNDTFSIRGYGKYHLSEIGAQSRKGRVFVSYFEY